MVPAIYAMLSHWVPPMERSFHANMYVAGRSVQNNKVFFRCFSDKFHYHLSVLNRVVLRQAVAKRKTKLNKSAMQ